MSKKGSMVPIDLASDWKEHTRYPDLILDRLEARIGCSLTASETIESGALACHLYGEHLGDWPGGLDYLNRLEGQMPERPAELIFKLGRQRAILSRAADPAYSLEDYSQRDKLHIVGLALPAIMLKGSLADAQATYAEAKSLADRDPSNDEAARFFAVVITNLVCDLIEQPYLPDEALAFVVQLAHDSRTYWFAKGAENDREHAEHRSRRIEALVSRPHTYGSGRYPRYGNIDA